MPRAENMSCMKTTSFTLDTRTFSCTLRFSNRRRSVQIRVPQPDCLELAAPTGMSWPKIRELVKTKRTWKPNIQRVRAVVNGDIKRVNVCTRCLRSGKVQRAI